MVANIHHGSSDLQPVIGGVLVGRLCTPSPGRTARPRDRSPASSWSNGRCTAVPTSTDSKHGSGRRMTINDHQRSYIRAPIQCRLTILGGTSTADRCCEWSNLHGMHHDVVVRPQVSGVWPYCPGEGWLSEASADSPTEAACCMIVPVASTSQPRVSPAPPYPRPPRLSSTHPDLALTGSA